MVQMVEYITMEQSRKLHDGLRTFLQPPQVVTYTLKQTNNGETAVPTILHDPDCEVSTIAERMLRIGCCATTWLKGRLKAAISFRG